jgi:GT2 family glycosyltransferase
VNASRPLLTVIVPAHQAAHLLGDTLGALAASDLPRALWELVVVDDASTDPTAIIASPFADTVVRLAGDPHGPSYARNRGSEFSRGGILVFVDADVRIHPDALRLVAARFAADPDLGAVFGSYDDRPAAPGLVSQYRNLLHHFVHHESAGEAETFWAGLGAVRADVFAEAGKYDEWHYLRPQIEDIELGRRIRRLGHRIALRPEIQGTHLKRWTLWEVLKTDFQHRGVPWVWLLIHEGPAEAEQVLNVRLEYRISTALTCLAVLALLAAPVVGAGPSLAAAAALIAVVGAMNLRFYRLLVRRMGVARTLAALPVHLFQYVSNGAALLLGWLNHRLFGVPATPPAVSALADSGVKAWPPFHARPRSSRWTMPPRGGSGRERPSP